MVGVWTLIYLRSKPSIAVLPFANPYFGSTGKGMVPRSADDPAATLTPSL
jgi:hypothetical protein